MLKSNKYIRDIFTFSFLVFGLTALLVGILVAMPPQSSPAVIAETVETKDASNTDFPTDVRTETAEESLQKQQEFLKPYFYLTRQGASMQPTDGFCGKTLVMYTDGLCPDCQRLETQIGGELKKLVDKGILEIEFHPVNFVGKYSSIEYPLNHAAWTLGVSRIAPDKIFDWIQVAYDEKNAPEKDTVAEMQKFFDFAKQAGLTSEETLKVYRMLPMTREEILLASADIRNDQKLLQYTDDERVHVPFVYVEGETKAYPGETEDNVEAVLKPLEDFLESCKCETCKY